jgi:hypothetical protein
MMIRTALGLQMRPNSWTKTWQGLFASRPTIYISVILVATLVSYAYQLRTQSIFACPATWYDSDHYIAYCGADSYGDYEHGAFWFDLEPSAQAFAKNADVLFLGDSRLQIGFSTTATANWFSTTSTRYYLLGFAYWENMVFAEGLLRRIQPKARVYVINVDGFFERSETPPVKTILHDPEARRRYEVKRLWQRIHEPVCRNLPRFCRHELTWFRSRETGAYINPPREWKPIAVSYDQAIDQDVVNSYTDAAILFLSQVPVKRSCIILTMVPKTETKIGNAKAVATALGTNFVAPEISEGLGTDDGSHLTQPSAQRWSQAFFEAAGSKIRSCLEEQGAARL